jgi:hypothetical protein
MHSRGPRLFHLGVWDGTFWLFLVSECVPIKFLKGYTNSQCVPQDVLNSIPVLSHIHCPKISSFHLIQGPKETLSNRNFKLERHPKLINKDHTISILLEFPAIRAPPFSRGSVSFRNFLLPNLGGDLP